MPPPRGKQALAPCLAHGPGWDETASTVPARLLPSNLTPLGPLPVNGSPHPLPQSCEVPLS